MDNSNLESKIHEMTTSLGSTLNDFTQTNRYFTQDYFICRCKYSKRQKKWCININLGSNHWFIDCSNFEFKGSSSNKISFPTYYRGVIDLYLEIFQNIFNEKNTLE